MASQANAYIVGAYEHPTRKADDKSLAQLHADVAKGALEDAGLTKDDIDGYFCDTEAPGLGALSMVDYLGLKVRYMDNTDTGGSAYLLHVAHAANAIAQGKCSVALITLAGRPRAAGLNAEPVVPAAFPEWRPVMHGWGGEGPREAVPLGGQQAMFDLAADIGQLCLLKLHAGPLTLDAFTTQLGRAAELSEDIDRMVAAREEVHAFLRFPEQVALTPV